MKDIEKLHQVGLNFNEMLSIINDELGKVTHGWKALDAIEQYHREIQHELTFCHHDRATPEAIEASKITINDNKNIIADLQDKLSKAFLDYMKNGHYIAIAYNSRSASIPTLIGSKEWKNLIIDVDSKSVFGEKCVYSGISFVTAKQIEALTTNKHNPEKLLQPNPKIDVHQNKEIAKEPKVKRTSSPQQVDSKPRKRLIPLQRETTTGLLLLYDIFREYNIAFLDELPATKAWGKIISGEFVSEHIKSLSDSKKTIVFVDETKLQKSEFLEKYRKRFQKVTNTKAT